jgi:hypothetical protein
MRPERVLRSNDSRSFIVRDDCTGSPEGCVELRVVDRRESGRVEIELHLSPRETVQLRDDLNVALREVLGL